MDGQVIVVDVPDHLGDEVEEDPLGYLLVSDGIFEVFSYELMIRL